MKQALGVSRRNLLIFAFGKVTTPRTVVKDLILETITTAYVGPTGSWLINFRERFK